MKKFAGPMLTVTVLGMVPVAFIATEAHAAAAPRCVAVKWTTVANHGKDKNRASAECSTMPGMDRVRPKLDRKLQGDITGSWFTDKNKVHYTAYGVCNISCSARAEWATK